MSDLGEWRESFDDLSENIGDSAWRGMSIRRANARDPDCGFGLCRNRATVVVEHAEYGRRVVCEEHAGANAEELFGVDPLDDGIGYDTDSDTESVSSHSYTQSRLSAYQGRVA